MDQLNQIKLEESDPMANSWENDRMVITAEFSKIARELIQKGVVSSTEAVNELSSNVQQDRIFYELFPILFNIELCKHKSKAENSK